MNKTTKETLIEELVNYLRSDKYRLGRPSELKQKLKQALDQAHTAGRQERTAEVVEMVEGSLREIKNDFLARCEHKDYSIDGELKRETTHHIEQALTDIKNHLTE